MIKIAVCDDNLACLNEMKLLLKEHKNYADLDISYFERAEQLLQSLNKKANYDILFMDIEMPTMSGLECVKEINKLGLNTVVIFTTSYTSYVSEAFKLDAFQYLTKPLNKDLLFEELDRALQEKIKRNTKLYINNKGQSQVVEVGDILFVEVANKRITVHTKDEEYTQHGKLSLIYEKLKMHNFVYCNQSILVNLVKVKKINNDKLSIKNCDKLLPISRKYKSEFLAKFTLFSTRCSL